MKHVLFRISAYFKHSFKAFRNSRGYGVHSPFAFSFITELLNTKSACYYYCFEKIEAIRHQYYRDKTPVALVDGKKSTLSHIAKTSATTIQHGQLLFRITQYMQCKTIIELGTSLGLGTCYLSCVSKQSQVVSLDHDPTCLKYAKKNINTLGIKNCILMQGPFEDNLRKALDALTRIDFIFFDGHHNGQATLHYFHQALDYIHPQTIFAFHDIHWSSDMHKAWHQIIKHPMVSMSFEKHNLGIITFNPEHNKKLYYA